MAAGGFKEFVAGETLDEDEINDFLMQGVLVFAGTAARGSAITTINRWSSRPVQTGEALSALA
jgi:hypothetical protein